MPQRNAYIEELRRYDDPENPTISPYDVVLPPTTSDAVIVPSSGLSVTGEITRINGDLASRAILLSNNLSIYVAKSGSDTTGDGTSSKPFLTIQKAISEAQKFVGGMGLTIRLGDGIYESEGIAASGIPSLVFNSTSADKSKVTIRSVSSTWYAFRAVFCNQVQIENLTFELSSAPSYAAMGFLYGNAYITNSTITDINKTSMAAVSIAFGSLHVNSTAVNNGQRAFSIGSASTALITSCSGSGNTIGYYISGSTCFRNASNTFEYTTEKVLANGGQLFG